MEYYKCKGCRGVFRSTGLFKSVRTTHSQCNVCKGAFKKENFVELSWEEFDIIRSGEVEESE